MPDQPTRPLVPIERLPKTDENGKSLPERGSTRSSARAARKAKPKRNSGRSGKSPRPYDRLKRVQNLLTLCYTSAEIRHTLAEEWNCSPETISKYIQECYKIWKRDARPTEDERNRTSEALARVFQMALKEKQLAVGIRAMEIRARILGLFTEKITVNQVAVAVNQAAAARIDVGKVSDGVLDELERLADEQILALDAPREVVGDAQVIDKKVD